MSDDTEPKFHGQELKDKHAVAIGRIAMAWNELHENLAEFFGQLFEEADYGLALTSWHALVSDNAQREMLRAVAEVKLGNESKAYKELYWSLKQIKKQISNLRNTGVHMPLMSFTDLASDDRTHQILPLSMFGNRKAIAMETSGKDILKEYADYERQIRNIGSYCFAIMFNVSPRRAGPEKWPGRPNLDSSAQN